MRILSFLSITLIAFCCLTSCNDDDEPTTSDIDIVGTWENVSDWVSGLGLKQYIQFSEDGTCIEVNINNLGDVNVTNGYWNINGDELSLSGGGAIPTTSKISNKTANTMTLNTAGIVQNYKKVPDSTIAPYL